MWFFRFWAFFGGARFIFSADSGCIILISFRCAFLSSSLSIGFACITLIKTPPTCKDPARVHFILACWRHFYRMHSSKPIAKNGKHCERGSMQHHGRRKNRGSLWGIRSRRGTFHDPFPAGGLGVGQACARRRRSEWYKNPPNFFPQAVSFHISPEKSPCVSQNSPQFCPDPESHSHVLLYFVIIKFTFTL